MSVGSVDKQFAVMGTRQWSKGALGVSVSAPRPFETLPITYDCAYGGTDNTHSDEGPPDPFFPTPGGGGSCKNIDRVGGPPYPNTEELDRPVELGGDFAPMAFSPIGRGWMPRMKYAGT